MSDQISVIQPSTTEDVCEVVRAHEKILPVGRQTKPLLSAGREATILSTKNLSGIVQYEASEFTFTARAGTTIGEIEAVLADRRQYLPFDPPLSDCGGKIGATIGGTVAAGLSGSGQFRFGGIRDFLLGVQFVAGDGSVIQAGGKVVKNAAGFDIPKLMVGSLGKFGVLTELTFKVFPKPPDVLTIFVDCQEHAEAFAFIAQLARSRFEFDAIDYRAIEKRIALRLRGDDAVNRQMANVIGQSIAASIDIVSDDDASLFWSGVRELNWHTPDATILKVPHTPAQALELIKWSDLREDTNIHVMAAGAVSWIALSDEAVAGLHQQLCKLEIPAVAVMGPGDRSQWGYREPDELHERIRCALDPVARFV